MAPIGFLVLKFIPLGAFVSVFWIKFYSSLPPIICATLSLEILSSQKDLFLGTFYSNPQDL